MYDAYKKTTPNQQRTKTLLNTINVKLKVRTSCGLIWDLSGKEQNNWNKNLNGIYTTSYTCWSVGWLVRV